MHSAAGSETAGVPLRHSLRLRLVLLTSALTVTTAAILLAWSYSDLARSALEQRQRELQILAASAASRIDQLSRSAEEPLVALAARPEFRSALKTATHANDPAAVERLQTAVLDAAEAERGFISLQLYDVSGLPVAGVTRVRGDVARELRSYAFTAEPEALTLARRRPRPELVTLGPLVHETPDGSTAIHVDVAVPVFDERGARAGVLLGEYLVAGPGDLMAGKAADLQSVSQAGFALVDLNGRSLGMGVDVASHELELRRRLEADATRTVGLTLAADSGPVVTAAAALTAHASDPGRYSFLAFTTPEATVLAEVRAAFARRLAAAVLLMVAAVLVTLLFARTLVRPLDRLLEATRSFGSGQPPRSLPVRRRDEVGRLAAAFALAARQVEERSQEVQQEIRRRQQTEDDLREKAQRLELSEASFRALYEDVAAGICVLSPDGRIISANPAYVAMTGYASEQLLRDANVATELWAGPGTLEEFLRAARQEGELTAFERRLRRVDGRMIWLLENIRAVWGGDGEVLRYESTCVEITDRKHAEYAQRASEMRFRRLSDSNVIGVAFGSLATGLVTELNQYVLKLLGYQRSEVPLPLKLLLCDDWREMIEAVRATGHLRQPAAPLQKSLRHRDGTEIPVMVSVTLVDPHGDEFVAAIVDQSAAVNSLREIRELKEFFRVVLDSIPTRVAYVDVDKRVRFFNQAYLDWYGTTSDAVEGGALVEVIGQSRYAAAAAQIDRALAGEMVRYESCVEKDGCTRYADVVYVPHRDSTGRVVGFFSVAHDVSEARELEARLRQSQRLEAVGQLTGGIAHDFNNLLSVIIGNLQLQERQLPDGHRARRPLEAATRAALRGAELTARLLSFSRRQALKSEVLDVREQVDGLLTLVERTLGDSICVVTDLPAGLWPVATDPGQFDSAMLNLAINARDAMDGDGTLTISARNVSLAVGRYPSGRGGRRRRLRLRRNHRRRAGDVR